MLMEQYLSRKSASLKKKILFSTKEIVYELLLDSTETGQKEELSTLTTGRRCLYG